MRILCLALVSLLFTTPVVASGVAAVEGLEAAVKGHEAALLSGDVEKVSATVMFPHVQFYPDGRVVVYGDASDFPDSNESDREWRVKGMTLVTHEGNQAIVRASFERTGARAGEDVGAGLWCFTRVDGKWLINWRHYLGVDLGVEANP